MINRNTSLFSVCQEFLDLGEQCKATLELLCFLFFAPCTCPDQRGGENPLVTPDLRDESWKDQQHFVLRSDRAVYRWSDRKEGMIVKRMKKLDIKYRLRTLHQGGGGVHIVTNWCFDILPS